MYIAAIGNVNVAARAMPDFLRDDQLRDMDVLVVDQGGAKDIVFDVEAKVAGTMFGIRDGAVNVNLYIKH
jgi:hypothetical protein